MVELIVNNNKIELPSNSNIKYTKQISDIFDLSQVSCSYTNSFEFEKTPANTRAMQQAGISGDGSNIPYQKNIGQLKSNGFDLISNGWFVVSSTEQNYKGSIIDGMIDFFKAIENKTLGLDLDLSGFEHTKDLNTVIDSFTNEYYKYIIADYGGKTMFEDGINIDYLAPCFSVKKMWELIFATFNFNCDYANLSYLEELYLTYPKEIDSDKTIVPIGTMQKNPYVTVQSVQDGDYRYLTNAFKSWDSSFLLEGSLASNNWSYIIPETNSYNFNLEVEMYVKYFRKGYYDRSVDCEVIMYRNGVVIGYLGSSYEEGNAGQPRFIDVDLGCDAGDVIHIEAKALNRKDFRDKYFQFYQWRHNKTILKVSKTNLGTTRLGNELKDFQIKDFIKEIFWRTGLTPVYDKETNTVNFITLNSRIDFSNAKDLSHAFIERTSEVYVNGYAQKNIFKLKNNNEGDTQGDGYLYVTNKNIDDEKILVNSKIYAPDKKILTQFGSYFSTNQYKIWETEVKDNNGTAEINYKGLSGRFYFIRKENKSGTIKIISEILDDEENVTSSNIPVGVNTNTLFEEAVFNNYSEYQKIFNNFRIHTISLALNENDFIGLDLKKPVFFKQENAYYICNKISFQNGEKSTGEFIKINKL